jgi:hypothetical protein
VTRIDVAKWPGRRLTRGIAETHVKECSMQIS